jgi:hypothetical protein
MEQTDSKPVRKRNRRPNAVVAELQAQALELYYREKLSYDAIAKKLGITRKDAYENVRLALKKAKESGLISSIATVESTCLELDELLKAAWPTAIQHQDFRYIKTCLEIIQERSKLLGLYPVEKVDTPALVQLITILKEDCVFPNPGSNSNDTDPIREIIQDI